MLTGRESLRRLIGKRRRFLPNRQSILSSPLPQNSLNSWKNEKDDVVSEPHQPPEPKPTDAGECEWVNCPICGIQIRSAVINSHLDECLASGRKRKLSQRTLFEFNFCSRSNVKIQPIESNSGGATYMVSNDRSASSECDSNIVFDETKDLKGNSGDESELLLESTYTESSRVDDEEEVKDEIKSPSMLQEGMIAKCDLEECDEDGLPEMSLQTFIVGRRFADKIDVNSEMKVVLSRDPKNVKDPNAIKVLSADDELCKVLGFLPRQLAQYLSPLIDKFHLSFEGCVTSAPKQSLGVAPIQIVCRNSLFDGEESCEDLNFFKSSWRHVMHVADSAKAGLNRRPANLSLLMDEVLRTNSHILTDDEKTFLGRLTLLSDDSQTLFVRLYTRKGPWFRMSTISYTEILDLEGAVKELSEAGYICSLESEKDIQDNELDEILDLLNVTELRDIANILITEEFKWPAGKRPKKSVMGMKKQDLIGLCVSSCKKCICSKLPRLILHRTGSCIRIAVLAESLMWRAERLFFLNGEQDLSSFLLVDFGIVKYPSYKCVHWDQIFQSRRDLLSYEEAIEVAQVMDESIDINNIELVLRCIEVSDFQISSSLEALKSSNSKSSEATFSIFSASLVYSKVVLLGISFLERERRYIDAINLLKRLLINFPSDRRRGYWALRLSVDLEHIGRIDESLQVAEDALLDSWVRAGSRMALQRRVLRLGRPPRRWKIPSYSKSLKKKITEVHIEGRPLTSKTGIKSIFYGEDGERCGVEQLALQYYAGEGGEWQGVHTESGIWLTIFGILMWNVIFADVPNAFFTKFQTSPLDLETDSFYESRKALIEEVLEKVKDGMAEEILISSWELHVGTMCRGVNWERHSLAELRAAVTCIGGPCLASLLRHLAQGYRSWSSGMPDLLLWRFYDDCKGEAKLVEVKGPRDRLSEQQHAWLLFLMEFGFSVEVCKVTPPSLK